MKSIIVEKEKNSNIKLSSYIFERFPNLSKNVLFKAIRNKDIKINDKRISKDEIVKNNDKIDIYIIDNLLYNLPEKITYIYVDDNILIAYKPQGILSNNEESKIQEPTFEDLVKKEFSNAKICHRLDRNTAGMLIFSLNDKAYDEIMESFKNSYIKKEYIAYVSSCNFEKKYYTFENYITKDSKTGYCKIYDNKVKGSTKAIINFSILKKNIKKDYAILNVDIPTGKTHQIRAFFKYFSHPIIGDPKYGDNTINNKFKIYKQMLYAYKYTFSFPEDFLLSYLNNEKLVLPQGLYIKDIGDKDETI